MERVVLPVFLLSSKSEMRLGIRTPLYCNELLSCAKKRELALLLILHVEVKSRVFLQSFANKTALVMATLIFCQETPQAEKEIWHQFSEWYLVPATIYWGGRRAGITWKCSFGLGIQNPTLFNKLLFDPLDGATVQYISNSTFKPFFLNKIQSF